MNRVLIDTDILSYFFKGNPNVISKFEEYLQNFDVIEISIITYYEIISGLLAKNAIKQLSIFDDFVTNCHILPMTQKSAQISANLYASLRKSGNTVDDIDLFIAGIAIENNITLVTNNERHFSRIEGLVIENWSH